MNRSASLASLLSLLILAPAAALAAGPITSGQVLGGALASPTYQESWTFTGTAGDRVLIAAVTTSGAVDTRIRLRNPALTEVLNTTADRVDYQLLSTGTYTIFVEDSGLNDAGGYNLSLLNVTAGPLTSGSDTDGGAIASAEIKTGQMQQPGDFDAFTFTGSAGQRVVFAALATSGASFNTEIYLYPPGGGPAQTSTFSGDRLDAQLAASGTYTVVVQDFFMTNAGNYTASLMNVSAGPYTTGSDTNGGSIASAEVKSATFGSLTDMDAWSFSATNGDRVLFSTVLTPAGSADTQIYLYPPGGGAAIVATSGDRADLQLNATGTWVVLVQDAGFDHTGSYNLSLLNVTAGPLTSGADTDGGAIASAEIKTGQMHQPGDFDAFTFTGSAGQRVVFAALATSGASFNTEIYLYPPGGGPAQTSTFSGDRLDAQLAASGTYTVVVQDFFMTNAGNYTASLMNVSAGPYTTGSDTNGGSIASAEVKSATFGSLTDMDAWSFSATNGDRVLFSTVLTPAGSADTQIYLYPPGGGAAIVATSGDRADLQLNATGTWVVLVQDAGFDHTGSYNLSLLNVTAGPLTSGADTDGGAIASAEIKTGQMHQPGDFDAFTFTGSAGQRVVFAALATSGASFNTEIYLYPPGGGPAQTSTFSGDRLDAQLAASGTYTVVVQDFFMTNAGNYTASLMNVSAGPYTTGSDTNGGSIASAEVKSATFGSLTDMDAWSFSATNGDRVLFSTVLTPAGSADTQIYLYPPGGGAAIVATSGDRADLQLNATGTWVVLVQDAGFDHTGSYNLSLLNVTAGPLTSGADTDGGAIASAEIKTGQMHQPGDFDAFTFTGSAGQRVVFAALATSGASFNTEIYLYPPGGGPAQTSTFSGDRLDAQLAASGTYTVVVQDFFMTNAGNYTASLMNVSAGPYTSGTDADGGPILGGDVKLAQITPLPDLDGWTFSAAAGDTAKITAVVTAGAMDTMVRIYPPGGGNAVIATSADNVNYAITTPGTYTIQLEDAGLDQTGSYTLTFQHVTTVTAAEEPEAAPVRFAFARPFPNPARNASALRFDLPAEHAGAATLEVFDVTGRRVRTLLDRVMPAGRHEVRWDLEDANGSRVASGTYFARLVTARTTEVQRVVVLK